MTKQVQIAMGALSAPIHEQLGVPAELVRVEQKLADAITLCSVQGILTDAETRRVRTRLVKNLGTFTPKPGTDPERGDEQPKPGP